MSVLTKVIISPSQSSSHSEGLASRAETRLLIGSIRIVKHLVDLRANDRLDPDAQHLCHSVLLLDLAQLIESVLKSFPVSELPD